MGEQLTAEQYREALALVLAELRDLPTDALEKAQRLGRLEAHVATIAGQGRYGARPIDGLAVLRREQDKRALADWRKEAPIEQS